MVRKALTQERTQVPSRDSPSIGWQSGAPWQPVPGTPDSGIIPNNAAVGGANNKQTSNIRRNHSSRHLVFSYISTSPRTGSPSIFPTTLNIRIGLWKITSFIELTQWYPPKQRQDLRWYRRANRHRPTAQEHPAWKRTIWWRG